MVQTTLVALLVRLLRPAALVTLAGAGLIGAAVSTPAAAWWRGGGFYVVAPPVYIAPPIYPYPAPVYPPPAYYAPPPVSYAPAPPAPPQSTGQSCFAGPYACPMDHPTASGSACYCLSNERSKIWGRAS
jgi:hypothetical protein